MKYPFQLQIADVNNISMNMVISTDGKSTHSIPAAIYLLKVNYGYMKQV